MIDQKRLASLRTAAAVRDLISSQFAGDVEACVDAIDSSLNRLLRTDLKKATQYVNTAQRVAPLFPSEWEARFISLQARLALWKGDYATARDKYLIALEQFQKNRNFEAAARLRKGLVEVLMYLGEYRDAVATGQKALRFFRRKGLKNDEAQLLTNIGNVYHRSDRNRLALQYYSKARHIFSHTGGVPLAIVDYNRANIFSNLNDLKRAKRLYLDAASIYKDAGLEIAESQAHYSVAYLDFLESKYAEALEGFERVYDAFLRLGDERMAAITLLDLVELEVHLHLYSSAIYLGEQVIGNLKELKLAYEEGKANYFVALAMLELRELAQARTYLRRAEKIFKEEKNELWLGMVMLAHGQLALADGRIRKVIKFTEEADLHFSRSGDKRRQNDARLVQVEALAGSKQPLLRFEAKVKELRASGLVRYQQYKLSNLAGSFYLNNGETATAVDEFKTALEVAEEMLQGLNQDEIRALFATDITESYNHLAEAYIAEQNQQGALVEVLRGLAVLNLQSRRQRRNRLPANLRSEVDSLRSQIARLQRAEQQPGQRRASAESYKDLEQRLWRLQRTGRAGAASLEKDVVSTDRVEMILSRLGNRTLVHYHHFQSSIGAFVASGDRVRHVDLGVSQDEFQRVLRKTYFLLEQGLAHRHTDGMAAIYPAALNHYRALLYRFLIEPITSHLNEDQLIFAVDREFLQVPFAILSAADGTSLHEMLDLTLLVNPLDLSRRESELTDKNTSVIIGSESDSLPLVRYECESIGEIYPQAQVMTGESAATDLVRKALNRSDGFVHIAAHAARVSENPLFSRILLADGPLFPFEITGRIKARLITLSGCQTAAPGLYYGNSFSLAKAFYQAGGRAVLASLWSVADDITVEFMTEFYQHLNTSKSVNKSYHKAVKKIRELTDNPAHWGAFVLLGAAR